MHYVLWRSLLLIVDIFLKEIGKLYWRRCHAEGSVQNHKSTGRHHVATADQINHFVANQTHLFFWTK